MAVNNSTQQRTKLMWPNLSKDQRALELAKIAIGWSEMRAEQQMDASSYLLKLAQEFKCSLMGESVDEFERRTR
jgi:hypothetical protein